LSAAAGDDFYERLIAFAKKYDIIVVHDNAYSEFIHDGTLGKSFLSFKGAKDIGIEFNSLSKSYNLTGLRISFALGNKEIITAFKALRTQIDYGISMIDQKVAIAALNGPQDIVDLNRAHYKATRDALYNGLNAIGWKVPLSEASMFSWLPVPTKQTAEEFVMDLIDKAGVIVTPGTTFGEGGEGFVRAALVPDAATIETVCKRIKDSGILNNN
jgi:LL-diaminopimelate aminotransferase